MHRPAATAPAEGGRRARRGPSAPRTVDVDVVVVGAGRSGLSTAYHLDRTGLAAVGSPGWERARGTYVVLDQNPRAGGAWQHRPRSLTMADARRVHDLPGMPLSVLDPSEPAADAVPYYFAQYEEAFGLNVQRPVRVTRVERATDGDEPRYRVTTRHVDHPDAVVVWSARGLVNASGTWTKPFWPACPGRATFQGRQLHARDVREASVLADGHVVVVGGGTSAVQLLLQVAQHTSTTWVTRRRPVWADEDLTAEPGHEAVAQADERARAGLPPGSEVSATGLPLTPVHRAAVEAGVLRARPMFARVVPDGVEWDDADPPRSVDDGDLGGWVAGPSHVAARTILWATGFRPSLDHLAPLHLRGPGGGIAVDRTEVVAEPRVQLVGYGPSASTVGADRAGREAARRLRRLLRW